MKAKEVIKLLKISRPTLCKYLKTGLIKGTILPNGTYDYEKESVYKVFNNGIERANVIYARVSTIQQKQDLENQVNLAEQFSIKNGLKISNVYKDIGSGINFDRKEFKRLLDNVVEHKIDKIIITYKDRLSRIGFDLFKELFEKFNCEIIVINDIDNDKIIEKEIFNEIISLIHCFSMKVYSNRRKDKLKLIEQELKHEEEYGEI